MPLHGAPYVADLARDMFLYKYGGFYFDLDVIALRNWDPLLAEYPNQMLAYAWAHENYPNNAFLYCPAKHPVMEALFGYMMRRKCADFGFQKCGLKYDKPVPLTVLPCQWLDDGWLPGGLEHGRFFR